jgi:glycosyltransferase involved in cell wall biosynthesis
MWSFTGRCAYRFDCQKHLTGCDATCPTADEYPRVQPHLIRDEWERRRDLFRSTPGLVAVTPSRWLADEARAGLWAGHRVEVIPNGLPLEVFHPVERGLARAALGLPSDRPVLVVAAQHLGDRRKGGHLLSAALPLVAHRPLTVLTLGEGRPPATGTGIETVGLGYVTSDRLKALAYSAADVFVHPAPADNLPNVLLEALACGTPAVGFAVGGMPDVIRPGVSGWLAPEPTAAALARAITEALGELAAGADYRPRCRDLAEREYAQHTQAERYLALFRSLTRAA